MNVLPSESECDCVKCSEMCHAPCCGTIRDIVKLIEAGYADRLMLDDWPGDTDLIKPALKGHEARTAPWSTLTKKGCTFWKEGKCELHESGLKPTQGKLAHHGNNKDQVKAIEDFIRSDWNKDEALMLIEAWKTMTGCTQISVGDMVEEQ